jgi:hypothetical protein
MQSIVLYGNKWDADRRQKKLIVEFMRDFSRELFDSWMKSIERRAFNVGFQRGVRVEWFWSPEFFLKWLR